MREPLSHSLGRAVAFIAANQRVDGGFDSISSSNREPFGGNVIYQTTLVPTLILSALAGAKVTGAESVQANISRFLKLQASPQWSFNYWANDSPERSNHSYPDDLDDTACAFSALWLHNGSVPEAALAGMVKLLLATESQVGGPYRTWLVGSAVKPIWLDVDLAINANVNYFLSLVDSDVPRVTSYLDQAIISGQLESPYYPSAYPILYYLARGYRGRELQTLLRLIEGRLKQATTPLEQALCLGALGHLRVSGNYQTDLRQLLKSQQTDGSWPADAFCLDPMRDSKTFYNGAAVLTTALVAEALQRSLNTSSEPITRVPKPKSRYSEPVLALASQQMTHLGPELQAITNDSLASIAHGSNGSEIIELPRLFNSGLKQPFKPTKPDFFETLSLANLYGWLAYTIYDDFLDGEGQPRLLSTANFAMRASQASFVKATPSKRLFHALVSQTFDHIDGANAWEQEHARASVKDDVLTLQNLPDYQDLSQLADRSLGHTLSPLAILVMNGQTPQQASFRAMQTALKHYLIARQLNDDAHDWREDLERGQLSYVVTELLKQLQVTSGEQALPKLVADVQQQFWHHTLPKISQTMLDHVQLSHQALVASGICKAHTVLMSLLSGIESSANETIRTQRRTVIFLRHYQGSEAA